MFRKNIGMFLVGAAMCLLTGFITYNISGHRQEGLAVIDAVRLFNEFSMKKELEQSERKILKDESQRLDSVDHLIQIAKAVKAQDAISLGETYDRLKRKLDDDYTQSNRDINEQGWKRLNPLLEEYGKQKKVHLIIGANGMGSVLFTDGYYDVTEEAINYINKKYAEGN